MCELIGLVGLQCWHAASANTSGVDRRTLTIRYIPFHLKPLGAIINNASVLDARGWLNSPMRRQLLGLQYERLVLLFELYTIDCIDYHGWLTYRSCCELTAAAVVCSGGPNWHDPDYCEENPRADLR